MRIYIFSTLVISIAIILTALLLHLNSQSKSISIGYCPTMYTHISHINNEPQIKLVNYQSSSDALSALNQGVISGVVIGRKAKNHEISRDLAYKQLDQNAKTLIKNIGASDRDAYLALWKEVDYTKVELVVILNENGDKLSEHRSPFFYYSSHQDQSEMMKIVSLMTSSTD